MEFLQQNLAWIATAITTLLVLPIFRLFQRVHHLETRQEQLATKADFGKLEVQIAEARGDVRALQTGVKALHHQFGIFMESYLNKEK